MVDSDPKSLAIIAGVNNLQKKVSISNLFFVDKIIKHNNFDTDMAANDIAIIKLKKNVTLSSKISLACLPANEENKVALNKSAVLLGWYIISINLVAFIF